MKVISLGLQCSVPEAIKQSNLREYSYPFDWLWSPSKTSYNILKNLINDSIEKALEYMTTGYNYYRELDNERFEIFELEHYIRSVSMRYNIGDPELEFCKDIGSFMTTNAMNKNTGLGNTYCIINDEYKNKLRIRLERLLIDIKSNENILFIYADAVNPDLNYYLDGIEYGLDATEYLLKIYELIYPLNNNIKIVYFCWNERKKENGIIEYISYDYKNNLDEVTELIKNHLINYSIQS